MRIRLKRVLAWAVLLCVSVIFWRVVRPEGPASVRMAKWWTERAVHIPNAPTEPTMLFLSVWEDLGEKNDLPPQAYRCLETVCRHHTGAVVWIFSNTLPRGELKRFALNPFQPPCRVVIHPWSVASIFEGSAGGVFMEALGASMSRGENGNHVVHASDAVRLALIARYGGIYIDMDSIILRPLDSLHNALGTFAFPPHMCHATDDWCVIARACVRTTSLAPCEKFTQSIQMVNGLMAFQKGHLLIQRALSRLDALIVEEGYRPLCWNCYGPQTITWAFGTLSEDQQSTVTLVAESVVFGYAHRMLPLLAKPSRFSGETLEGVALEQWKTGYKGAALASSIAERIQRECFTQHIYGGGGLAVAEEGSVADVLLRNNALN